MPESCLHFEYNVLADDFTRAGEASSDFKNRLKQLNLDPTVIRRVSIAMYEGEINMVIHAHGGKIDAYICPDRIRLILHDNGPGIADIEKAMELGYSTAPASIMSLGFGAGMGLPNMKRNTDKLDISSVLGEGTTVDMVILL